MYLFRDIWYYQERLEWRDIINLAKISPQQHPSRRIGIFQNALLILWLNYLSVSR